MKRMNGMQAFEAMTDIDPQYILKCAPDAPVKVKHRGSYLRVAAIAAALAVLAVGSVIGWGSMNRGKNPSPTLPSEQESGNAADSADTQEGTQTPTESMPPVVESQPPEEESKPSAPISGSYTTDKYTVEEIEGKHYISFADGNEKPTDESGDDLTVITGIYFASLEEMQKKFLTGDFTEKEILQLKGQLTLTDKGFEIPDMTKLYDAVLPEGWSVYQVCLDDQDIYLSIRNDKTDCASGFIAIHSEKYYDMVYQRDFVSYIEQYKDSIVRDETEFHGIPCQVYKRISKGMNRKDIVMKVPMEDCTFDVLVKYRVPQTDVEVTNWGSPYSVSMYGEMYGLKVEVYLSEFANDPQGDFYQAFGIQPYQTPEN